MVVQATPDNPIEVDFAVFRTTTDVLALAVVRQQPGEPEIHFVVYEPRLASTVWHVARLPLRMLDATRGGGSVDEPMRLGSGPSGSIDVSAENRRRLVDWASALPETVIARLTT